MNKIQIHQFFKMSVVPQNSLSETNMDKTDGQADKGNDFNDLTQTVPICKEMTKRQSILIAILVLFLLASLTANALLSIKYAKTYNFSVNSVSKAWSNNCESKQYEVTVQIDNDPLLLKLGDTPQCYAEQHPQLKQNMTSRLLSEVNATVDEPKKTGSWTVIWSAILGRYIQVWLHENTLLLTGFCFLTLSLLIL